MKMVPSRVPAWYEETWKQEKESWKFWKLLPPSLKLGVVFVFTTSQLSQKIPEGLGLPGDLRFTKDKSEPRVTSFKNWKETSNSSCLLKRWETLKRLKETSLFCWMWVGRTEMVKKGDRDRQPQSRVCELLPCVDSVFVREDAWRSSCSEKVRCSNT